MTTKRKKTSKAKEQTPKISNTLMERAKLNETSTPTKKRLSWRIQDTALDIIDFFTNGDGAYVPAIALAGALAFGGLMYHAEKNNPIYTIKTSDRGLSYIAKEQLGDASRWKELYELNKEAIGSNPNILKPGMTIYIPKGE